MYLPGWFIKSDKMDRFIPLSDWEKKQLILTDHIKKRGGASGTVRVAS